jgi:hypothetical protein
MEQANDENPTNVAAKPPDRLSDLLLRPWYDKPKAMIAASIYRTPVLFAMSVGQARFFSLLEWEDNLVAY